MEESGFWIFFQWIVGGEWQEFGRGNFLCDVCGGGFLSGWNGCRRCQTRFLTSLVREHDGMGTGAVLQLLLHQTRKGVRKLEEGEGEIHQWRE